MKGKNFILSFLVLAFLIGNLYAYTTSYNENTKTLTILNDDNTTAMAIKLLTPVDNPVPVGNNIDVVEFELNFSKNMSFSIENTEFFNLSDNSNPISKSFQYKNGSVYSILVDDYGYNCVNYTNSTTNVTEQNCSLEVVGNHTENRIIWDNFVKTSFISGDVYRIALFTDVGLNDKIEWIPTFDIDNNISVRVINWADWEQSLNVGLFSYYNLDEMANDGETIYDYFGLNNGTNSNAVGVNNGFINNDYRFDGNGKISFGLDTILHYLNEYNGTISLWAKINSSYLGTSQQWILEHFSHEADSISIVYNLGGNNKFRWGFMNVGNIYFDVSNPDEYNHFVLSWKTENGTSTVYFYLNGVLINSTVYNPTAFSHDRGQEIYLGSAWDNTRYLRGYIDEVYFYNRSLTSDEVFQMYNYNSLGITYPFSSTQTSETTPTFQNTTIYQVLDTSGAGLGRFIELVSQGLLPFLIILVLIGIVIVVGFAIADIFRSIFVKGGLKS